MPAGPSCGAEHPLAPGLRTRGALHDRGLAYDRPCQNAPALILCRWAAWGCGSMSFGRALKRRMRDAVLPVAFGALCAYFAWNSQLGDFGLVAREQKLADIAQARAALTRAEADRDALERRVTGLRGDRIDRDQ